MNFFNRNIKEIVIKDNIVCFQPQRNNSESFELKEINKIFIKKSSYILLYFFFISIPIFVLIVYYFKPTLVVFCCLVINFLILYLWVNKRQYSLILFINEEEKHEFNFHRKFKFEFVEQIKTIRQKINEDLFYESLKTINK